MGTPLLNVFGEDASPKVKKFMKVLLEKLKGKGEEGGLMFVMGSLALDFMTHKLNEHDEDYAKPALETKVWSKDEVFAGVKKRLPRR